MWVGLTGWDDICSGGERSRVSVEPWMGVVPSLSQNRDCHARWTAGMTASPGCKRDLPPGAGARRTTPSMTPQEFEARIVDWARRQPDIKALVQIGSRAQAGEIADALSDWDFHLISTRPQKYYHTEWLAEIAPSWCAHAERTLRGVIKVSAVFEGGMEADFIPLAAWQMKLVYWGMRHPGWVNCMPARLHRGILETRVILLGSGHRVLIGGKEWEQRLTALEVPWATRRMSAEEFSDHTAAFWQKAVWVAKKIARPEPRSAMHWLHKLVLEHVYAVLEEEAWLAGRVARPLALKAEKWLEARRLAQTAIETGIDQRGLARALLVEITLFEEVSRSVAGSRGFVLPDYSEVEGWLRTELTKLTEQP